MCLGYLDLSAYVTPAVTWIALAAAVVLAGVNLMARRPGPAAQTLRTTRVTFESFIPTAGHDIVAAHLEYQFDRLADAVA